MLIKTWNIWHQLLVEKLILSKMVVRILCIYNILYSILFQKKLLRKYISTIFSNSDDGLQDINNVFTDSSTYQPEVPSNDAEILVHTRLIPILILLLNFFKKEMELKLDELDYHFRYFKNRILKMKVLMVNLSLTIPLVKM